MTTSLHDLTGQLVRIIQEIIFTNSDRDVAVDQPLGEYGVGLDSLAIVQFLTAVEHELGVEIPVDVWSIADEISLLECTAAIARVQSPTSTARELTRIWQELLGVAPISPTDSFLQLQGDHDRLQEMWTRMRAAFGILAQGLEIETFLERPTIAALAATIDDSDDIHSTTLIVPLQTSGDLPPLFLVHAGGGYGFFYRALASSFSPDRPVYAIRAAQHGDAGGESFIEATSVEAVADRYIRAIKSIRPRGPYALGGACIGGVFALEIARQLRTGGDQVLDSLLLFDSFILNNDDAGFYGYAALRDYGLSTDTPELARATAWRRGRYKTWTLKRAGIAKASLRLGRGILRHSKAAATRLVSLLQPATTNAPRADVADAVAPSALLEGTQALDRQRAELMRDVMDASLHLLTTYRPEPFDGRLIFFNADDTADFYRCWKGLATKGINIIECPGQHLEMLEQPAVVKTASIVAAALRTASPQA